MGNIEYNCTFLNDKFINLLAEFSCTNFCTKSHAEKQNRDADSVCQRDAMSTILCFFASLGTEELYMVFIK